MNTVWLQLAELADWSPAVHGTILVVLSTYTGAWCTVGCLYVRPFQFLEKLLEPFVKCPTNAIDDFYFFFLKEYIS